MWQECQLKTLYSKPSVIQTLTNCQTNDMHIWLCSCALKENLKLYTAIKLSTLCVIFGSFYCVTILEPFYNRTVVHTAHILSKHCNTKSTQHIQPVTGLKQSYMWQSLDRNRILFHRVFPTYHRVWRTIALSFCWGWGSYALHSYIRYSYVHTSHMSPALSGSSAL